MPLAARPDRRCAWSWRDASEAMRWDWVLRSSKGMAPGSKSSTPMIARWLGFLCLPAAGAAGSSPADCDAWSSRRSWWRRAWYLAWSTRRRLVGAHCDGRSLRHGAWPEARRAIAPRDTWSSLVFELSFQRRVMTVAAARAWSGFVFFGASFASSSSVKTLMRSFMATLGGTTGTTRFDTFLRGPRRSWWKAFFFPSRRSAAATRRRRPRPRATMVMLGAGLSREGSPK